MCIETTCNTLQKSYCGFKVFNIDSLITINNDEGARPNKNHSSRLNSLQDLKYTSLYITTKTFKFENIDVVVVSVQNFVILLTKLEHGFS